MKRRLAIYIVPIIMLLSIFSIVSPLVFTRAFPLMVFVQPLCVVLGMMYLFALYFLENRFADFYRWIHERD